MKRLLKFLPCFLLVISILCLTCVQAFALDSYQTNSGDLSHIAFNQPSRVIFAGSDPYRSAVTLSDRAFSESIHSIETAVTDGYTTALATLHVVNGELKGNPQANRSVRCDGYHAWNILGQSNYSGMTVTPSTSWFSYPGSGQILTDSERISSSTDVDTELKELGMFQFKTVRYEFSDYFVDSKITSNINNTAYLSHIAYVAVPAETVENDSTYNTVLSAYSSRSFSVSYTYYDVNGRLRDTTSSARPVVEARGFQTIEGQKYLIVDTRFNYESAIYDHYASINAYKAFNGITPLPNVRIEYSSPPANIGGVSGQGQSPYYNVGGFAFVGADYSLSTSIPDPTPELPPQTTSLITWITDVVGGFLNIEFFGFIRLGDILGVVVSVGLVMFLLKMFAGG